MARRSLFCIVGLSLSWPSLGAQGRVTGVVFDSLGRTPLVGALVQFVPREAQARARQYSARSDSSGSFHLAGLPSGEYLAGFFHSAADSLGLEPEPVRVTVTADSMDVVLATPSPRTLSQTLCGDAGATSDSTSFLFGHVRAAASGAALSRATVVVEWTETILDVTAVRVTERADTARAGRSGLFTFCGLPGNLPLLARATFQGGASGYIELELPSAEARHVTFLVDGAVARSAPDSTGAGRLRGTARLAGAVRDVEGRAIGNARVLVLGAGAEQIANQDGYFGMDSLPGGTWTLEVRAIGRSPLRRVVQLHPGELLPITVELGDAITLLPTEYIRGEVVYSRKLQEFERRRRTQFTGKFLTTRDLAARPMTRLSAVLQAVQGVEVQRRGAFAMVMMRATSRVPGTDYCAPSLYVDGVLDAADDYDRWMAEDVMAVEVYPRESMRPPEFTNRHRCGSIAIWLRPARTPVRPRS